MKKRLNCIQGDNLDRREMVGLLKGSSDQTCLSLESLCFHGAMASALCPSDMVQVWVLELASQKIMGKAANEPPLAGPIEPRTLCTRYAKTLNFIFYFKESNIIPKNKKEINTSL